MAQGRSESGESRDAAGDAAQRGDLRRRGGGVAALRRGGSRAQTVYGLAVNPLARVEKHPQHSGGNIEVFSPEEVWALVRAATLEQDGALFLTAAFTGLRMGELLALRWRDLDSLDPPSG